ncbi:hypothetical protein GCM10009780_11270 [Actinomadura alba]
MTRLEREGDQQSAQPRARDVGQTAVVCADLEWPQHPDLHPMILPWGVWGLWPAGPAGRAAGPDAVLGDKGYVCPG